MVAFLKEYERKQQLVIVFSEEKIGHVQLAVRQKKNLNLIKSENNS